MIGKGDAESGRSGGRQGKGGGKAQVATSIESQVFISYISGSSSSILVRKGLNGKGGEWGGEG